MPLADSGRTFLMDVPLALSTQISTVILNNKPRPLEFGPGCILPFLSLWSSESGPHYCNQTLTGCGARVPPCLLLPTRSSRGPCLSRGGQKPLFLGLILPLPVCWVLIIGSVDREKSLLNCLLCAGNISPHRVMTAVH